MSLLWYSIVLAAEIKLREIEEENINLGRRGGRYSMRWKTKSEPQWHDSRIKEHFLFFPKKIENEWRWLERAKYK